MFIPGFSQASPENPGSQLHINVARSHVPTSLHSTLLTSLGHLASSGSEEKIILLHFSENTLRIGVRIKLCHDSPELEIDKVSSTFFKESRHNMCEKPGNSNLNNLHYSLVSATETITLEKIRECFKVTIKSRKEHRHLSNYVPIQIFLENLRLTRSSQQYTLPTKLKFSVT